VLEVSDVLTDKSLPIHDQGDAIFQIRTHGKKGTTSGKNGRHPGSVSTGKAKHDWAENSGTYDGIVQPASNGALPDQKGIRDG